MKMRFLLILLAALYLVGCSSLGQGLPLTGGVASTPVNAAQTTLTGQTEPTEQNANQQQNSANEQSEPTKAGETPEAGQSSEQQNGTNEQTEPTKAPEQNEASQTAGPTEQTENNGNTLPVNGQAGLFYANQLLDYNAVDSAGNQLGDVKDLIIDLNASGGANGTVPYVVVTSNMKNDWYIPVPWKAIQVNPNTQTIVLPLNANQLNAAPGFNKDAWPASFAAQNGVLQNFWANPGQANGTGAALGPAAAEHQATDYLRGKDLTDMKVISQQGAKLGKIQDLALNVQNGQTAGQFGYVVFELDDSLGGNNLRIPVPWRLARPASGAENVVVNIAPNILQSAPNFAKGMLPNLYSEPLNTQLNTFWNGK